MLTGVALASVVSSNAVGAAATSAESMAGETGAVVRAAEDAPLAPSGLRAAVCSSTAGELFWDRPATFGLVYEVRRDGGTPVTTDGISHYDDTLVPGESHDYEVVAIDREG